MTVSVLAPVRDEGGALREQVPACLRAVSDLAVEFILIDNQSIDGCCRGLPPDVLVVQTDRLESPWGLWRLGRARRRDAYSGFPTFCHVHLSGFAS